jgi:hypothetical protein
MTVETFDAGVAHQIGQFLVEIEVVAARPATKG